MVNEQTTGKITSINEEGVAVITATIDPFTAAARQFQDVTVIFHDGRRISPEQRRKTYALIGEIAEFTDGIRDAATIEETKRLMKFEYLLTRMEACERRMFSLADCDMTVAREFISFLIDFIIENEIPTRMPLVELADDVRQYVYACLINKNCAVCGKAAQLHHVDPVGMGNDREEVCHIGMLSLPLCAEHHAEAHAAGVDTFNERYHLEPVEIDEKIAKVYRLKYRLKARE